MRLPLLLATALLALTASSSAAPRASTAIPSSTHAHTAGSPARQKEKPAIVPVVILDSPGGTIATFQTFYRELKRSHVPVRVRGWCVSACTMVLHLPRWEVCVEPTAVLGFHMASVNGIPDQALTVSWIRREYPPAVQKWFVKYAMQAIPVFVGADEMVKRGWVRPCTPLNQ